LSSLDGVHDFVVHNKNNSGTSSTENVGKGALEETTRAFGLEDFGKAIGHTVVDLFTLGLGGFILESSLEGVKRVSGDTGRGNGDLGNHELAENSQHGGILLPGVEGLKGILETELDTTVDDDTNGGGTNTVVEGSNTVLLDSLGEAIDDTVVHLDLTDISTESGSDIDEGVDECVGNTTSKSTGGDLSASELGEIGVLVESGEDALDGVLEHEVASGGGDVADAVSDIASPEGLRAEFTNVAFKAVTHTAVSLHFTGNNAGVGVLGLDSELDLLKGSSDGL